MKKSPLVRKTPLRSSSLTLSELRVARSAPLKRTGIKRGTSTLKRVRLKAFNPERVKRKLKKYRARLAKADWQKLRLQAYERDGGLCQCPPCIQGRKNGEDWAFEPIEIWYDVRGKIHGFDVHHVSYARWGREELSDLLTMKRQHHMALEARTGKRHTFLMGMK